MHLYHKTYEATNHSSIPKPQSQGFGISYCYLRIRHHILQRAVHSLIMRIDTILTPCKARYIANQ